MSKFCNNCGSVMEDDVVFCPNCGAQDQPAEAPAAPAKKLNLNPKTLILGAIAAVVALILALVLFCNGPKNALNRYQKVYNGKGKIEKLFPKDYFDHKKDQNEEFSKSDFLDNREEDYEEQMKAIKDEYGDNAKVKFTIVEKKKMNKEDKEDYAEVLEKSYGINEKSIKQIYRMAVRVDVKGKDGKSFYYDSMIAFKVDGKWYITDPL